MKSEIRFVSPSLKITITIGFFVTIIIISLAVLYRYEFSVILWSTCGLVGTVGVVFIIRQVINLNHNRQLGKLQIAEQKQRVRLITFEADKAALEANVLSFPKSHRQLLPVDSRVQIIEAQADVMRPMLLQDQNPTELLPALDSVQRCLIVGSSDSGKTTLLKHIVKRRSQSSKVVVIDPHASPNKWQGCLVMGTGRNYTEIDKALAALIQIMDKRYDEIGKGQVIEGQHEPYTILIDEWRAITQNVKPAGDAIKALLTESRKAAMSVFVATHSDRAKPLGLQGEYDLKDGFAVVRLSVVNGQRQATLDTGNGEYPAILPGPFYQGQVVVVKLLHST